MNLSVFFKMALAVCFSSFFAELSAKNVTIGVFSNVKRREELFELAKIKQVNLYFFNHQSFFDWKNKKVRSVIVFKEGKWQKKKFAPLPEAVYDYSFYAPKHNSSAKDQASSLALFEKAAALKEDLKNHQIPFYMKKKAYLLVKDKLQFAAFAEKENLSHPQTLKFSKENFKTMLSKHKIIYLKPQKGFQGYGIVIIKKIADDYVSISYRRKDPLSDNMISVQIDKLLSADAYEKFLVIKRELKTEKEAYLIQEGINYLNLNGRQTHFRVMTQRGKDGILHFVECIAKVGGNVSEGGKSYRTDKVLKNLESSSRSYEQMMDSLKEQSLKTHLMVEKYSASLIGELGSDLVLDKKGKAVVIETNNKPGLLYFDRLEDIANRSEYHKETAKKAAIKRENHILDYGIFLSKASKNEDFISKVSY